MTRDESVAMAAMSRRDVLIAGAGVAAAATLPFASFAARADAAISNPSTSDTRKPAMSTITTKDGTQIYYKDWGTGQPIVFSASLKIYPGGTHSLGDTSKEQLNEDLLAFVRA